MKNRLCIFVLLTSLLMSCQDGTRSKKEKTDTPTNTSNSEVIKPCVLDQLPLTVNYKKALDSIREMPVGTHIYERLKTDEYNIRTEVYVSDGELKITMFSENLERKWTREVIIFYEDYVEYLVNTDTTFNLNKCSLNSLTKNSVNGTNDIRTFSDQYVF